MIDTDEIIEEIVHKTWIYKAEKKNGQGQQYYSYNAQVLADLFEPFSHSLKDLMEACVTYGFVLNKKIEELSVGQEHLINMSAEHICDETLAHLLIWFSYGRRWKWTLGYKGCKEVDLNIDEDRFPIKQFIGVVGFFRKRSRY